MKFNHFFAAGAAALALFAMSCSDKTENPGQTIEGEGQMKITLAGENYKSSRAAGPSSTAAENAVKKFTVYVFNAENDALETSQTFTNATTGIVSGLSTGFPKKIVVIANAPTTFPTFHEGDDYSKLTQAASGFNLTYQTPANIGTNGLVMLGETENPITLAVTGTTNVAINMKRLVAKVTLGTINVLPIGDYEIDEFEVTGVSIQRAVSSTDIFGNRLNSATLFGGLVGSMSLTSQSFLYDAISADFEVGVEQNMGNYFYVLPNQNPDDHTLITLISKYNDDVQYFPISINAHIGDDNTDGTYILSNKSYIINITVNNLGEGTTDPDVPPTTAPIEVTLTVDPWDMEIVQDVIW